jgi:hypothetical protein
MSHEDQILRIQDVCVPVYEIVRIHGIHVVDYGSIENLIAG